MLNKPTKLNNRSTKAAPSRRNPQASTRWHVLGTRGDKRDPAALEFARLGLLASRW